MCTHKHTHDKISNNKNRAPLFGNRQEGLGCGSVMGYLTSIHKTLSSILSTDPNNRRRRRKTRTRDFFNRKFFGEDIKVIKHTRCPASLIFEEVKRRSFSTPARVSTVSFQKKRLLRVDDGEGKVCPCPVLWEGAEVWSSSDDCSKSSSQRPGAMLRGKALATQAQGPEFGFLTFMLKSQTWRCVSRAERQRQERR